MNYVYAALAVAGVVAYGALCVVGACMAGECFADDKTVAGILWLTPSALLVFVQLLSLFVQFADIFGEGV